MTNRSVWQPKILTKNKRFNLSIFSARKNLDLSGECYKNSQEIKDFWLRYSEDIQYQEKVKIQINNILDEFNLERFWFVGIFSYVLRNNIYRPPSIWLIKKENFVSVNIGENISKKQLIDWIKNNWDKKLENQLKSLKINSKLPKKIDDFYLYQEIFSLKEKGLSFSKIAEILSDRVYRFLLLNIAKKYKIEIKSHSDTTQNIEKQLNSVSEELDKAYKVKNKINLESVKQRYFRFKRMIEE